MGSRTTSTRTRYGISPWVAGFTGPRPGYPTLRRDLDVPVVIIGGGLTGCATAYAAAAAGVRCALVEVDRIATWGTGRSSGLISADASFSYGDLEARHGRRAARAMFQATRRAALDLGATVRRLGLKAPVEPRDAVRAAAAFGSDALLRREAARRREAGLDASWLTRAALARMTAIDAPGGMRLRAWGQVDPYRLAVGFARAAAARGAVLFERTRARRVRPCRHGVEVVTEGGLITAGTVVVCTEEPGPLFPSLQRHLEAAERYVVLTEPMPAAMRRGMGSYGAIVEGDARSPSIGWTVDHRIVIEGADRPRLADRARGPALVQRTGQLMYELLVRYPAISGLAPAAGWHVPMATTADGAMYAGPHRNFPRHLFAWGTGHDPSRAFLASRILLRHVTGTPQRDDAWFAFTRG